MSLTTTLAALAGSSDALYDYPTRLQLSPPTEDELYTSSLSVPGTPYYPDHPSLVPGPIARPSRSKAIIGLGLGLPTINKVVPRYQQRRASRISERRAPLVKAGIIPSPIPQTANYPTVPSGVPGWPDLLVIDSTPYGEEENNHSPPIPSTSSSVTLADSWSIMTPPYSPTMNGSAYDHYVHQADYYEPLPEYLDAPSPGQLPIPHFHTPLAHQTSFLTATPPYLKAPPPEDLPTPIFYPQPAYPLDGALTASHLPSTSPVFGSKFRPFSPVESEEEVQHWATKPLNPNAPLFQARIGLGLIYETGSSCSSL